MKHETSTIDSMQQSESVSVIVQKYRDKYQSSLSDDSKSSQQSQEHKFQPAQPPTKQSAHPLSISNFQEDSSPKETLCLTAIQSTNRGPQKRGQGPKARKSKPGARAQEIVPKACISDTASADRHDRGNETSTLDLRRPTV